jgi:hypothetical protein
VQRSTLAGVVAAAVTGVLAATSAAPADPTALRLGTIVRITTPGTSLCPAEGEPEVTSTALGTWVAYNDDHQCPLNPTMTRIEEVQLVPAQGGAPKFIPLDPPSGQLVSGDPDLAPAPDGGVYVSALWTAPNEGSLSLRLLHVTRRLRVEILPTPSFHGSNNFDDKEFIASDSNRHSPWFGRVYVAWDDIDKSTTVLRGWDGHRWSKPVVLAKNTAVNGTPDVAVGPGGLVGVTFETPDGAVVRFSRNGGRSFGRPVLAMHGGDPGRTDPACPLRPTVGTRQRALMGPRIAFDRAGDAHVVAALGHWSFLVPSSATDNPLAAPAVVWHATLRPEGSGARFLRGAPITRPTSDEQWAAAVAALPHGGVAVVWLQTRDSAFTTYDAWISVLRAGATRFTSPQRLSKTSARFPFATEAVGNSDCYGLGDYIGVAPTSTGVASVWPSTDTDVPGIDSDVLLRPAAAHM